ncbi:MAG: hypothetical protein KAX49_06690 [Halanaerobiales bacterium]|nr:hypothetical protein [Halanaerobiales bacterium]
MPRCIMDLKQYTPLIHFQSDQEGATIRATELKPKLDSFLVEYAFKKKFKDFEDYLIGDKSIYKIFTDVESDKKKKKPSFDYKVRIFVQLGDNRPVRLEGKYNSFFGNQKKSEDKKMKGVFSKKDIRIEIFSLNEKLIKIIKTHLSTFFALTNFGMRQNKGFGSFYIKGKEEQFLEELKEKKRRFFYLENTRGVYSEKEALDDIFIIYALMKGGINVPKNEKKGIEKSYYKSYLFKYMLERNIGNEKRFIKRKLLKFSENKSDSNNEKYVRALLGVTESVKFRSGEIKYKHDLIKRFKSPITFKVVGKYIAIIPEEIPEEIFDKEFSFVYGKKKEIISTPLQEEFDLIEFLSSFANYFNNELEVKDKNLNFLDRKLKSAKMKTIIEVNCYGDK